jgi:hypothetical protein
MRRAQHRGNDAALAGRHELHGVFWRCIQGHGAISFGMALSGCAPGLGIGPSREHHHALQQRRGNAPALIFEGNIQINKVAGLQ